MKQIVDTQNKYSSIKQTCIFNAFCEGLLISHHLTVFFLYSEFFKATSSDYQIFETVISFKFVLHPLMGYLMDHYSVFGSKKRFYMIINGLCGFIIYSVLANTKFLNLNLYMAFLCHLLVDISNGWRKLINDSLCVILNNYLKDKGEENKDHSKESMDAVYGTKYIGMVISWLFFLMTYNYFKQSYFYFLAFICLTSIYSAMKIEEEEHIKREINFRKDLQICTQAIKDNQLMMLVTTCAVSRMSPSFIYFFDFYLKLELNFTTKDFTFKYLLRDVFFYLSLFLMNKVFKNIKKSFQLKFIVTFYFFIIVTLVLLINQGPVHVLRSFTSSVLILYQSFQLVLFDLYLYPVMAVLWQICPDNLEGFFMGIFAFMNEFFLYIGTLLGTVIIYMGEIKSGDYRKVCILIITHLIFILVTMIIVYSLRIPEKPEEYPTYNMRLEIKKQEEIRTESEIESMVEHMENTNQLMNQVHQKQKIFDLKQQKHAKTFESDWI